MVVSSGLGMGFDDQHRFGYQNLRWGKPRRRAGCMWRYAGIRMIVVVETVVVVIES